MPYNSEYRDSEYTKYIKESQSPLDGVLGGILSITGIAAVGIAGYRSGLAKAPISKLIGMISDYRGTSLGSVSHGVKRWASDTSHNPSSLLRAGTKDILKNAINFNSWNPVVKQTWDDLRNLKNSVSNSVSGGQKLRQMKELGDIRTKATAKIKNTTIAELRSRTGMRERLGRERIKKIRRKENYRGAIDKDPISLLYKDPEFMISNNSLEYIRKRLEGQQDELAKMGVSHKEVVGKYRRYLFDAFQISNNTQNKMLKQSGYRFLTLDDVKGLDLNKIMSKNSAKLFKPQLEAYSRNAELGKRLKNIYLDKHLLINDKGNIADLRGMNNALSRFVDTIANEFAIPFTGINPARLLHLNDMAKGVISNAHIPLIGLNELRSVANNIRVDTSKPLFRVIKRGTKVPMLGDEGIKEDLYYMAGELYSPKDMKNPLNVRIGKDGKKEIIPLELHSADPNIDQVTKYTMMAAGYDIKKYKGLDPNAPLAKKIYSKVMKWLDIGFTDIDPAGVEVTNPMTMVNAITKRLFTGKMSPHGGVEFETSSRQAFKDHDLMAAQNILDFDMGKEYIVMPQSAKFRDLLNYKTAPSTAASIGKQLWRGIWATRDNLDELTPIGLIPYAFMARLNMGLSAVNFGLSSKHTGSAASIYGNLMLRRVMPIMAGATMLEYINFEAEKITGKDPADEISSAFANASINFAAVRDMLGVTKLGKALKDIMPGSEQITDIPGLGILDFSRSADEMREYYDRGMDPVRKGRFWDLGNTPFTGGKVEYYRPNLHRRIISDWEYTDSLYGSKEEYFANNMFPTPRYPLAPVRHFLTDNRHWEEKHYKDRPYPISEGINEIEGIPIFGDALDASVGRLIKPPKKMHTEYWKGNRLVELPDVPIEKERPGGIGAGGGRLGKTSVYGNAKDGVYALPSGSYAADSYDAAISTNKNVDTLAYVTASGKVQVVEAPGKQNIREINNALKTQSLEKSVRGVRRKSTYLPDPTKVRGDAPPYDAPYQNTVIDIGELGGIYGFMAFSKIAGVQDEYEWADEMATPSDINNWSDMFWESNLGGLGGEFSEIMRRFIPRDKNKQREYNPIRNTMPTWLPGRNYFLDLLHGDPYRIPYGEIRLPGAAYESIWGLQDKANLVARASMLGKSKEEMVSYFFNENAVMSDKLEDIVNTGDAVHRRLQKKWAKQGFLIDAEVELRDEQYGYTGHYDARVIDYSSPIKQSIVDIKTVNDRKYREVDSTGEAYIEHIGQVNAYLHTMGMPKGYIYYYNRDDKNAAPIVKEWWYSESLFKTQMKNLKEARSIVNNKIESGEKNRGDLYDYLTRFRILADVAPYSNEYKEYSALMSQIGLNDEELEEVQEIKKRTREQKKSLRVYPYKFATANLKEEEVTVTKVLDNNTFLTEEYGDNPIRLAGIHVPTGKDDKTAEEAKEVIRDILRPGRTVTIGYDLDVAKKIANDTYGTIRAVVNPGIMGMNNLNKELLDRGLATEKDTDDSPAGVRARFSPFEIMLGSVWEKFAHLDTVFHTKFLHVRSPYEEYERTEVYGKSFKSWNRPIQDYLMPAIYSTSRRPLTTAVIFGLIGGALFGSGKSPYGRVVGGAIGIGVGFSGSLYTHITEAITGEKWIPGVRKKQREINEYIDMLKYIKSNKLYKKYAQLAKDKEDFDVDEYLIEEERKGEIRKGRVANLARIKKDLKLQNITGEEAIERAGLVDKFNQYVAEKDNKKREAEAAEEERRNNSKRATQIKRAIKRAAREEQEKLQKRYDEMMRKEKERNEIRVNRYMGIKADLQEAWWSAEDMIIDILNLKIGYGPQKRTHKSSLAKDLKYAANWLWDRAGDTADYMYRKSVRLMKDMYKGAVRLWHDLTSDEIPQEDKDAMRVINKEMGEISSYRNVQKIPTHAAMAIAYKQQGDQTMYGYDPGEPVLNAMIALPKKEREYFQEFIDAPEEEKQKILDIVPKPMRRMLQSVWGMEVDDKPSLEEYFQTHQLPGDEWEGWNEQIDMNVVKVKLVNNEALDATEFNIWPEDQAIAKNYPVRAPEMYRREQGDEIANRLKEILGQSGMEDIRVSTVHNTSGKIDIDMDVDVDRQLDVQNLINQHGESLLK